MKSKKLHILWINEKAELKGGCEHYVYNTAKLIKDYNVESSLFYSVDGWADPKYLKNFKYAFPMVDIKRQVKEINPDLIYVHRLSGRKPIEELIKTGKPIIRFFHDHKLFCLREHKYTVLGHKTCKEPIGIGCYKCLGFINRTDNWYKIKINTLTKVKREQKINKKLDAFIVGSKYMKDQLIAHNFQSGKIKVIPLYSLSEVQKIDENQKRDILLFVGQLVRGKGLDVLLKAIKFIKHPVKLIVCGSGRQEDEYHQLVKELEIEDRVEFKGKISKQKLSEYYKRAICVIIPSRTPETFGLTGLEAMSFGAPVIASKVGGMNEWLVEGKSGFSVPANEVNALAYKIMKFLNNDKLVNAIGEMGQKLFVEKFQPKNHLIELRKMFDTYT